ncbi:MAG: radical SAM protein [Candidatus Micrarchaeaceae archaeon]
MRKDKNLHSSIAGLVIIQSTPFCNLDCTYCYLPNRDSKERIKFETISNIARVVFSTLNISEKITVLWHAGEPLVVPRDFYETAHNIISSRKPNNIELTYNFQTNGTLIDDSWCEFLKRDNIIQQYLQHQ